LTPQGTKAESVRAESLDLDEVLDAELRSASGEMDDEVDGLSDQGGLGGDTGLLGELVEAEERLGSAVGVNGGEPSGVAGVPGLEEGMGLGAADLSNSVPCRKRWLSTGSRLD
jgi:hypothetical protein